LKFFVVIKLSKQSNPTYSS